MGRNPSAKKKRADFKTEEEYQTYLVCYQICKTGRKIIKDRGGKDILLWREPQRKYVPRRKKYGTQHVVTGSGVRQSALPPMHDNAAQIRMDWMIAEEDRRHDT